MNLGQIRRDVETELQYAPELEDWRKDVRQVINRVYQNLARERRWPWLHRQAAFYSLPDLLLSEGAAGITLQAGSGPRSMSLLRTALRAALGVTSVAAQTVTEYVQQQLVGAELDIASGNRYLGNGNWEKAPFVIEGLDVQSPSGGTPNLSFWLDPRANITTLDTTIGTFKLSFPRVQLPADCDALLAITDDQGNPLTNLAPEQARRYLRPTTVTAQYPSYVLEDGGFQPLAPDHLVTVNGVGGVKFDATKFLYARENWPVREPVPFAIIDSVAAGSMTVGTVVHVFVSWSYGGRWGPPSATVDFTVAAKQGFKLTGLPVLPNTTATQEYGRLLGVFVAEGEGAAFFRGFVTATASTFELITSNQNATSMAEGLRFARWDEEYPGGPYTYVRLLPRPTGLKRFAMEYLGRPRVLAEDTDSPEFEEAYHNLLVWLTCIEICTRFGQGKVLPLFLSNAERIRAALDTRYFPQKRYAGTQKGMIGAAETVRPTQTVDWHGDS